MKELVIGTPGLVSEATDASLRGKVADWLERAPAGTEVFRLHSYLGCEHDDLAWLGLDPRLTHLQQGPLTVAALGHDPPRNSTHYHVTPLALDDSVLTRSAFQWSDRVIELALTACERLNTKKLTLLKGFGTNHAMVIEDGSPEMGLVAPEDAMGKPFSQSMPDGDDAVLLRRFIDDSVNILLEQAFNHELMDEGLTPISVLWPWGCGFRPSLPNLLLHRQRPAHFASSRLRLAGLARLVSYSHEPTQWVAGGTRVPWEAMASWSSSQATSVILVDSWSEFGQSGKEDESEWLANEFATRFLPNLDALMDDKDTALTWLAPSIDGGIGLGVRLDPRILEKSPFPFDLRVLDDGRIKLRELHTCVDAALSGSVAER